MAFMQSILQSLIKETPSDPYTFVAKQFMAHVPTVLSKPDLSKPHQLPSMLPTTAPTAREVELEAALATSREELPAAAQEVDLARSSARIPPSREHVDMEAARLRAMDCLMTGARDGQLTLMLEKTAQQTDRTTQREQLNQLRDHAKSSLVQAAVGGQLEQVVRNRAAKDALGLDLAVLREKAKEGLSEAARNGELLKSFRDPGLTGNKSAEPSSIIEKTEVEGIRVRVLDTLSGAAMSGELDRLFAARVSKQQPANNRQASQTQQTPPPHDQQAEAQQQGQETPAPQQRSQENQDLEEVRTRVFNTLSSAAMTGELEQLLAAQVPKQQSANNRQASQTQQRPPPHDQQAVAQQQCQETPAPQQRSQEIQELEGLRVRVFDTLSSAALTGELQRLLPTCGFKQQSANDKQASQAQQTSQPHDQQTVPQQRPQQQEFQQQLQSQQQPQQRPAAAQSMSGQQDGIVDRIDKVSSEVSSLRAMIGDLADRLMPSDSAGAAASTGQSLPKAGSAVGDHGLEQENNQLLTANQRLKAEYEQALAENAKLKQQAMEPACSSGAGASFCSRDENFLAPPTVQSVALPQGDVDALSALKSRMSEALIAGAKDGVLTDALLDARAQKQHSQISRLRSQARETLSNALQTGQLEVCLTDLILSPPTEAPAAVPSVIASLSQHSPVPPPLLPFGTYYREHIGRCCGHAYWEKLYSEFLRPRESPQTAEVPAVAQAATQAKPGVKVVEKEVVGLARENKELVGELLRTQALIEQVHIDNEKLRKLLPPSRPGSQ